MKSYQSVILACVWSLKGSGRGGEGGVSARYTHIPYSLIYLTHNGDDAPQNFVETCWSVD